MRQFKKYPKVLLLAVVLLGSLPLIAVLQYNWLAQLSRAEYVRMQSNLKNVASRFSNDIDREILGAHFSFVGARAATPPELSDELSNRFNRWQSQSLYPAVVKSIYWIDVKASSSQAALFIYDEAGGELSPTAWPSSITDWIAQLPKDQERNIPNADIQTDDIISPIPLSGVSDGDQPDAETVPTWPMDMLIGASKNHLFLAFDASYIFQHMVPALVEQHFSGTTDSEYDILITQRGLPDEILYRSSPDLTVEAFGTENLTMNIGIPDQPEIIRMFSKIMREQSTASPQAMLQIFKMGFPNAGGYAPFPDSSIQLGGAESANFSPVRRWQLHIKHRAGTLDQLVSQARTRNLWISFLVLIILGTSIVLIVRYTRRSKQLADQQMAFVAGVSHELRTPLAVLHAAGENLKDGLITDAKETREYGKLIVDESQNLLDTLEQVLAYASISFGTDPLPDTEVDMNDLVRQILASHREKLSSFDVQLDLDDQLPMIRGDREALRTVVQNLIQNAIKYSNGKKWMTIKSHRHSCQKETIEIIIEDRGIGIEQAEHANIFKPFFRVPHVRKTQIRGNGLGLSIARQIVEAHGGAIRVESLPGHGSSFYVSLALTPPNVSHVS